MKVLMITPSYDPIIGGTERVVQNLTVELNQHGIQTDIMTLNMNRKWKPFWREEIKGGDFKLFRVPAINVFQNLEFNPLKFSVGAHVIIKLSFVKWLKDYDVLHFHDDVDLSFSLFSCFVKKPKVFHCHTLPGSYVHYKASYLSRESLGKAADAYLCDSSLSKKLLSDLGIPKSKIFILHDGVNPEKFKPNKAAKTDNIILFMGRISKEKGLHILLKALPRVTSKTQLAIIGPKDDSKYAETCMHMIKQVNDIGVHSIKYFGVMDEKGSVPWYQMAAILVRPDLGGLSGGLTSLEALSCGTPVIGTGNHVVQNEVNGIIVPPNDAEELAKALDKLLQNKELRERYGTNGRRIVKEQFSWDSIAEELIRIYETIC
jgi:glycosyltransferase involved in cell wall biosynthesis